MRGCPRPPAAAWARRTTPWVGGCPWDVRVRGKKVGGKWIGAQVGQEVVVHPPDDDGGEAAAEGVGSLVTGSVGGGRRGMPATGVDGERAAEGVQVGAGGRVSAAAASLPPRRSAVSAGPCRAAAGGQGGHYCGRERPLAVPRRPVRGGALCRGRHEPRTRSVHCELPLGALHPALSSSPHLSFYQNGGPRPHKSKPAQNDGSAGAEGGAVGGGPTRHARSPPSPGEGQWGTEGRRGRSFVRHCAK